MKKNESEREGGRVKIMAEWLERQTMPCSICYDSTSWQGGGSHSTVVSFAIPYSANNKLKKSSEPSRYCKNVGPIALRYLFRQLCPDFKSRSGKLYALFFQGRQNKGKNTSLMIQGYGLAEL